MKIWEICLIVVGCLAVIFLTILLCLVGKTMNLKNKITNVINLAKGCFKGEKDVAIPDPDGIIKAVRDAKKGLQGDFRDLNGIHNSVCDDLEQLNNNSYEKVDCKFSKLEDLLRKGPENVKE
jgi:hypothetical protein